MKSKVKDSKRLVSKLSCDSWGCRACAARKRRQSGRYVAAKLLTTDGVIFESASNPDEWQTQRKRLQRMRASWVRYGPLFNPGVIIGVAPSPFGAPICDREQAIIRLGEVIRDMKLVWKDEDSPCRPINYSRDWTPPAREDAYELLEWVRVKNPQALVEALGELGVCAKAHAANESQWDISYGIPPEWSQEQVDAVQRLIGSAR
jgi:hypothetical protein